MCSYLGRAEHCFHRVQPPTQKRVSHGPSLRGDRCVARVPERSVMAFSKATQGCMWILFHSTMQKLQQIHGKARLSGREEHHAKGVL